jgi:predicted nucleic acid-binding protein
LIELGKEVLDRAEQLGRYNKVRALDAIHIASFILFREATNIHVPLVTADSAQREAAADLSLDMVWVE